MGNLQIAKQSVLILFSWNISFLQLAEFQIHLIYCQRWIYCLFFIDIFYRFVSTSFNFLRTLQARLKGESGVRQKKETISFCFTKEIVRNSGMFYCSKYTLKWKDSRLQINLLKHECFKGKGFKKICVNGTNKGLPFSNITILVQNKNFEQNILFQKLEDFWVA